MKIFLFHGMGDHPAGWHEPVVAEIHRLWRQYDLSEAVFDRKFTFVPVDYDDIFVTLVEQWQATATSIAPVADRLGADSVARLVGWLREAGNPRDFVFSHAVDVLLYRGFSLVADAVRDRAVKIMSEHLAEDTDWAVIAHSLGTSVAHDALDKLWHNAFRHGDPLTGNPLYRQAAAVVMIANVSRVLESDRRVLDQSWVRPGFLDQRGRICLSYLNINHHLDPFTRVRPFDPTDWPDRDTFAAGAYRPISLRHVHELNVHDLLHTLRNPKAHIPLLRALHFERAIGKEREHLALEAFGRLQPIPLARLREIEDALQDIAPEPAAAFPVLSVVWDQFQDFLG
jgi:hypothetical protein